MGADVKGLITAVGQIWRLSKPYFNSEEKWFARGMMAILVALVLSLVYVNVQLNLWNLRNFNALQNRDLNGWLHQLVVYLIIIAALVVIGALRTYINMWLHIRWRRWMTERYLSDWLGSSNHYRMQLRSATDNPDQRISQDIDLFITNALEISVGSIFGSGLLGAVTTLCSFIVILWGLSAHTPFPVFGHDYSFPGWLILGGFTSAIIGTALSHVFGRQLIKLSFDQQRFEADFRFGLVRVRENSEQIALLKGEERAQASLMDQFKYVVRNYHDIMIRSTKLGLFQSLFGQFTFVLPSMLIAPSMLAGLSQFGNLMQTSNAFGQVEGSFAFFNTQYRTLATWKSIIDRLVGFEAAAAAAREEAAAQDRFKITKDEAGDVLEVEDLDIRLPNGAPLISGARIALSPGERVLVSGPSGAGKSTMLRAIGGIWPYGSGRIRMPASAKVMILPQKPFLPIGTLDEAITFPRAASEWKREEIESVMKDAGLSAWIARLDEPAHWSMVLSGGEQQRIGIARALLHKPDVLMLDEATASLDEASESRLYNLLREALPETTIVSIAHRSTLRTMHERRIMFVKDGDNRRIVEDLSAGNSDFGVMDFGVVYES